MALPGFRRAPGRGPAWSKALDWGSRDREFKSPRPDTVATGDAPNLYWVRSVFVAGPTWAARRAHTAGTESGGRGPERIGRGRLRIEEGATMADVEIWLGEVAGALDVTLDEVLPTATQEELLTLTGEIAHNVVRLAVPLSSYLIGVAVGRGASPQEAMRIVGELLPSPGA